MRTKVEIPAEEMNRQVIYMPVLAGPEIPCDVIDIEEAVNYIDKFKDTRKAFLAFSSNYQSINEEKQLGIKTCSHNIVQTIGIGQLKIIEDIPDKDKLLNVLGFKNGLVIFSHNDFSAETIKAIIDKAAKRTIDVLINRGTLEDLISEDFSACNFLRIHPNPNFQITNEVRTKIFNVLTEIHAPETASHIALSILLAQCIANSKHAGIQEYLENLKLNHDEELLDIQEAKRQLCNYVYYDIKNIKIFGCSKEIFYEGFKLLAASFNIPVEQDVFDEFLNNYYHE